MKHPVRTCHAVEIEVDLTMLRRAVTITLPLFAGARWRSRSLQTLVS